MKNLLIILSFFLLLVACKKSEDPSCEGPDCPLADGSYCPPNMYNENNQCICPPDHILLNDSLCTEAMEDDTVWTRFYTPFDCECAYGDILMGFNFDNGIFGAYSLDARYDPQQLGRFGGEFNFLPGSWMGNFNARMHPAKCEGKDLYMHGFFNGDTLTYELFFINSSTLDTCGPFQTIAL